MQKRAFQIQTINEIDPEDFGDTLLKLEKSFGIEYADYSFKNAKTFGDVCAVIESQINGADLFPPFFYRHGPDAQQLDFFVSIGRRDLGGLSLPYKH